MMDYSEPAAEVFDCRVYPDPGLCAANIADAMWVCSATDPVRPSILGYLDNARFEVYDTTQGLARDHRTGFQRGRIIDHGIINSRTYRCGSAPDVRVYKMAKELETRYGISQGSLPCRIVLVEHGGCTLAGMRVMIKQAGAKLRSKWQAQSAVNSSLEVPHSCLHGEEDKDRDGDRDGEIADTTGVTLVCSTNQKRSRTQEPPCLLELGQEQEHDSEPVSFQSSYVHAGRKFVQGLRDSASDLPSLQRIRRELNSKAQAVISGMERAKLITGPSDLLLISTTFLTAGVAQLKSLESKLIAVKTEVLNAEVARDILVGLDLNLHSRRHNQKGGSSLILQGSLEGGRAGGAAVGSHLSLSSGAPGHDCVTDDTTSHGVGYKVGLGHGLGLGLAMARNLDLRSRDASDYCALGVDGTVAAAAILNLTREG